MDLSSGALSKVRSSVLRGRDLSFGLEKIAAESCVRLTLYEKNGSDVSRREIHY